MSDEHHETSPVVGYVRSARTNDPRLYDWEVQIRAYAAECGYYLTVIIRDEGVSGVAPVREGLNELIRQVNDSPIVGVITPSPTHFAASATSAKRIYERITLAGSWVHFIEP